MNNSESLLLFNFLNVFLIYILLQVEKSWKIPDQFVVDHLQTSFDVDAEITSHAMTHDVYSPSQIRSRFNKISYAKAGSILRMTEKIIGSDLFYGGLHIYLENR